MRLAQVEVSAGHPQRGVPQDLLQRLEVFGSHGKVRCKGVPQVFSAETVNPRPSAGGFKRSLHIANSLAVAADYYILRYHRAPPNLLQVLDQVGTDRDIALRP